MLEYAALAGTLTLMGRVRSAAGRVQDGDLSAGHIHSPGGESQQFYVDPCGGIELEYSDGVEPVPFQLSVSGETADAAAEVLDARLRPRGTGIADPQRFLQAERDRRRGTSPT
jgi:hypothetical protein